MNARSSIAMTLLVAAIVLPVAVQAGTIDSPWQFSISATAGYNNNLGQAERGRDKVGDQSVTFTGDAAYKLDLGSALQSTLRGFLETEQWDRVRDISRLTAGGQMLFDWQPVAGPTAPSFQFNAGVQVDDYAHKQRDSTVITTQLLATKPISERVSATIGVEYRHRDSSGTVWDLSSVRGFLGGAFAFRPGWSVHGTYSYIDGDVWSTARTTFCNGAPAGDIFGLVSAADAIEPDEAFNSAFCGSWHAYRLPATVNMLELGVNTEIGQGVLLDFSAQGAKIDARGDNTYDTQIYRVSLTKRF